MHVAWHNNIEIAVKLLDTKSVSINARNESGSSALSYAAQKGSSEMAELLLENGADHTNQDNSDGTVLTWAALSQSEKAVGVLMDAVLGKNHIQNPKSFVEKGTALVGSLRDEKGFTRIRDDYEALRKYHYQMNKIISSWDEDGKGKEGAVPSTE